jgi:formate/nitrite transporter FocA (FNT family)
MKKYSYSFVVSIIAGLSIAFGCLVNLLSGNAIVGAFFFSTGLFLVLTRKYNLFTGKIGYLFDNKKEYIIEMVLVWLGNLVGTQILSIFVRFTHLYEKIKPSVEAIILSKTGQGYLSAFLLAVLCGIIIYLSVENYKQNSHEIGKYLGILLLIPLFIICGFEHCVADMFYFFLIPDNVLIKVVYLTVITFGNAVGSIVLHEIKKKINKE